MLHPFNIHYWSCDVGHRHPFPTITNLKSPPGKSFILSMNVLPDQTITLGLQIILDHRSLSSVDHCNNFDKSMSQLWQTLCKTYSQWVSEWLADWQGKTMHDRTWVQKYSDCLQSSSRPALVSAALGSSCLSTSSTSTTSARRTTELRGEARAASQAKQLEVTVAFCTMSSNQIIRRAAFDPSREGCSLRGWDSWRMRLLLQEVFKHGGVELGSDGELRFWSNAGDFHGT